MVWSTVRWPRVMMMSRRFLLVRTSFSSLSSEQSHREKSLTPCNRSRYHVLSLRPRRPAPEVKQSCDWKSTSPSCIYIPPPFALIEARMVGMVRVIMKCRNVEVYDSSSLFFTFSVLFPSLLVNLCHTRYANFYSIRPVLFPASKMSPLFFCTLIYTLCVLPTHASWLPGVSWHRLLRSESLTSHKGVGIAPDTSPGSTKSGNTTTTPYIFSVPSASIIAPTPTSQGMMVTSILPIYEVCDMPGKNTTSCSTAFETITTESCSTVLTYAFTKTTISDCVHNVTFSSRTTYALATTTLSAAATDLKARDAASPTAITYVRSTVLAYAAPWQSLAADTPGGITVMVCISDVTGSQICVLIEKIWAVHTEYVPITVTSTLSLSTSFSSVSLFVPVCIYRGAHKHRMWFSSSVQPRALLHQQAISPYQPSSSIPPCLQMLPLRLSYPPPVRMLSKLVWPRS